MIDENDGGSVEGPEADDVMRLVPAPAPELDDERRRYYRITPFGTEVARAETRRLASLVRLARSSGFLPSKA